MSKPKLIQVWIDRCKIGNPNEESQEVFNVYGLFDDNQIRLWIDGSRKWIKCYYTTEIEDEK